MPGMTIKPVGSTLMELVPLRLAPLSRAASKPAVAYRPDAVSFSLAAPMGSGALQQASYRAVSLARGVLDRFAQWKKTPEGMAYAVWRKGQELLPESMRSIGKWGASWGLDGYLLGNEPRLAWRKNPGGQEWRPRCNVFAYNMSYQAGFALPGSPDSSILRPASLAAPFLGSQDKYGVQNYFQRVPLEQVRPGDWVLLRNKAGKFSHVVMAAGGFDGQKVDIAHAGNTPKPLDEKLRFKNGKVQSWTDYVIIRPTRLRPIDPTTGQPVQKPSVYA